MSWLFFYCFSCCFWCSFFFFFFFFLVEGNKKEKVYKKNFCDFQHVKMKKNKPVGNEIFLCVSSKDLHSGAQCITVKPAIASSNGSVGSKKF